MVSTQNEKDFAFLIIFASHTVRFCGKPNARNRGRNTVQYMSDLPVLL